MNAPAGRGINLTEEERIQQAIDVVASRLHRLFHVFTIKTLIFPAPIQETIKSGHLNYLTYTELQLVEGEKTMFEFVERKYLGWKKYKRDNQEIIRLSEFLHSRVTGPSANKKLAHAVITNSFKKLDDTLRQQIATFNEDTGEWHSQIYAKKLEQEQRLLEFLGLNRLQNIPTPAPRQPASSERLLSMQEDTALGQSWITQAFDE